MNDLRIFNYGEKAVRTISIQNETWWVLKDVCEVLDIGSPHKVAERLDEDERSQMPITDSLGREQETNIINESGLYNVILRSDKPEAKPFRKWVTSEVLPSIRKQGAYMIPEPKVSELSPLLQQLISIEVNQKNQLAAIEAVNSRVDHIGEVIALDANSWREGARKLVVGVAQKMGGNAYISEVNKELYKLVDQRGGVLLETRLTNKRNRMAGEGVCKSKRDKINKLDVIAEDKTLVELYLAIVKEMAVKQGVSLQA